MSLEIKKYSNGYAVCVSPSEYDPFDSFMDYDEFLGNAFTFFPNVTHKYSAGYFDSKNDFAQSICGYFEDYREKIGYHLRLKWEQAKQQISGTHIFNEDDLTYWEDNANKVYQEHWKSALQYQLDYFKDCEDVDFIEFVENLDRGITISLFPFIKDLTLSDPYDIDAERKKWIDHLTSKMAEFESGIKLTDLDNLIDYFMYGDSYVENWEKFSMLPDPDYWTRYEETIKYYLFNSPFIMPVKIHQGYNLCIDPVYNFENLEKIEGFMLVDSNQLEADPVDARANFRAYANEFLSGDFYDADLVFIVPEGKQHLYPESEYSKEFNSYVVRDLDEPTIVCLGEKEALKCFDYIESQPPYDPVYNYTTLGQVQRI